MGTREVSFETMPPLESKASTSAVQASASPFKSFAQASSIMIEWQPITKKALAERVAQGVARMSGQERNLWDAIRIEPEKWKQEPYGNNGRGFWAVAVIGRSVIWYNDIEDGFNRSCYSRHGQIDDYWCNQDELEVTVRFLVSAIDNGTDLVRLRKPPVSVSR
jgi:hypothetical protein